MKIAIARLRSKIVYTEPLSKFADSFYECLREYINKHPEHEYRFYNFSFGAKTSRDISAIANSDVIIIPTENEFHAWVPNYLHPMNLAKSNEHIAKLAPHLEGKTVILLSLDRGDTPELYRDYTFAGVQLRQILMIGEDEFPIGITALNRTFIQSYFDDFRDFDPVAAPHFDFTYWGTEKRKLPGGQKSAYERHTILKAISKAGFHCKWIGRFANIKRDFPLIPMKTILPILRNTNATLCFNWINPKAITARYHEAIAAGTVPLVWKDYDSTNRLGILDWQRCYTSEDAIAKIMELRTDYGVRYDAISAEYEKRLPSYRSTVNLFEEKLDALLLKCK